MGPNSGAPVVSSIALVNCVFLRDDGFLERHAHAREDNSGLRDRRSSTRRLIFGDRSDHSPPNVAFDPTEVETRPACLRTATQGAWDPLVRKRKYGHCDVEALLSDRRLGTALAHSISRPFFENARAKHTPVLVPGLARIRTLKKCVSSGLGFTYVILCE